MLNLSLDRLADLLDERARRKKATQEQVPRGQDPNLVSNEAQQQSDMGRHTVNSNGRGSEPGTSQISPPGIKMTGRNRMSNQSNRFASFPGTSHQVTFEGEPNDINEGDQENPLAHELFGDKEVPQQDFQWNRLVMQAMEKRTRAGLPEEQRDEIVDKLSPNDELSFLRPPTLYAEIKATLPKHVVTRDEKQCESQRQVGACINAFATGITTLLRPELALEANEEVKPAIASMANGIHLLSDFFHRQTLVRGLYIKPSLKSIPRGVADESSPDDFIFGADFLAKCKAAENAIKAGEDVVNQKKDEKQKKQQLQGQPQQQQQQQQKQQPQRQQHQQRQQQGNYQGNYRAPARRRSASRPAGDSRRSQSRPRRSPYRNNNRPRRRR